MLSGGARPEYRLAIHQRHYAASLTRALLDRFPATVWLVGSELVTDAARSFVHEQPPSKPCISEYGDCFPHIWAHIRQRPHCRICRSLRSSSGISGNLALATDDSPNVHYLHLDWSLGRAARGNFSPIAPRRVCTAAEDVLARSSRAAGHA